MSGQNDKLVEPFPAELVDLRVMNRLLRHRLRNFCAGGKMTLDRISDQAGKPSISEKCAVLGAEFDNLEQFTRRMDLIFDRLPESAPFTLFELLTRLRQAFCRKFPLCSLRLEGPELSLTLPEGSLIELAIGELLANAGEAAGVAEGAPAVSCCWTELSGGGMVFSIQNSGSPIPPEIPLDPPMPFHTTRGRHDGLGLSIVNRIVKCLSGGLEIKSNTQDCIHIEFHLKNCSIWQDGERR